MVVTQLELSPEFKPPVPTLAEEITELLARQEPAFFKYAEHYEEIRACAAAASARLRELVNPADPASVNADSELSSYFLAHSLKNRQDPKILEYCERERLRDESGMIIDANYIIKKSGESLAAQLRQKLQMGLYSFGNNQYFVEFDPRQKEFPGRKNFYRLGSEEYPVAFGNDTRFDPIQEPLQPAQISDIVALARDLQMFTAGQES